MTLEQIAALSINEASRVVERYVKYKAADMAWNVGFGWVPDPDAPNDYDSLRAAYDVSEGSGYDLPVSSLHCDNVIFSDQTANHAMRFWHDTLHVQTNLSFDPQDELELGLHHLAIAEYDGIVRGSLEWQLIRIDLIGQNYLLSVANRFPIDQKQFVYDCMEHGLDEGILLEVRRKEITT